MVAKVGNDLFGEATVNNFNSFGIDTTHVQIVEGVPTGVAPIFVEPSGQNRIIVVKGANDRLTPADVDAAAAELRRVDTIILQFEIPLETIYHTVRFARANKIRCIVNPAPAVPAGLADLTGADYFIPNETEAELITGLRCRRSRMRRPARALLEKGFRVWSSRWARAARCSPSRAARPYSAFPRDGRGYDRCGRCVHREPRRVPRRRGPEKDALARANLYAALSTTRVGTQKSFPTRAEFEPHGRGAARAG